MHFSSKHADDVVRVAEKPFDKERILENLRQSRLARESSKFDDYLRTLRRYHCLYELRYQRSRIAVYILTENLEIFIIKYYGLTEVDNFLEYYYS